MHIIDYAVIFAYLLLMVFIGYTCRNASANISDYIRMGNKSTWWLAGFSLFMQGFSATTFTGMAGSAYIAGWSVMTLQWGAVVGFLIQAVWMAPIMRRTRAITPMDVVRSRFGPLVEQVKVYVGMFSSLIYGGVFLLGIGTFSSALFGIPLWLMIVVLGVVVVFYSVVGGSWSVQITDSLQALILLPVAVAFSLLCLYKFGGISGMMEAIAGAGLSADFSLVKSAGHEFISELPIRKGNFTGLWLAAAALGAVTIGISINATHRYLSLTDEKSASKAALLAAVLTFGGSLIWYIPPIYGRLHFADQIDHLTNLPNPADAAYAITALNMLPAGIVGLVFVSMLAATMSSMDSFLTGTAGIMVRNLYEPFMRGIGKIPRQGLALLSLTRKVNFALGLWAIFMAFALRYLSDGTGIFGIIQTVGALIGSPNALPFALALVYKRIPIFGLFAGIGCGLATSVTIFILRRRGLILEYSYEVFIMYTTCIVPTLLSSFLYHRSSQAFRDRVDAFFDLIKTPVNVSEEVGQTMDTSLLTTVGRYVIATASLVLVLVIFTRTTEGRIIVLGISGFQFLTGGFMWYFGHRGTRSCSGRRNAEPR